LLQSVFGGQEQLQKLADGKTLPPTLSAQKQRVEGEDQRFSSIPRKHES
jgi:hypothetical protein